MEKILLNDILKLKNLDNVKIRFNILDKREGVSFDPIKFINEGNTDDLESGHFGNYKKRKTFKVGEIVIGFARVRDNQWLLFNISRITKDLDIQNSDAYEREELKEYNKFFGRLIVNYKNKSQYMIYSAKKVMPECEVIQILENSFNQDIFPGYENINIDWKDLKRVIGKTAWEVALKNQKGVYLITDVKSGKRYVGIAHGKNMLLSRWKNYIETGHGGNKKLKELPFSYIQENFRYSILDIYKASVDDEIIRNREIYWKEVLMSREDRFGYNDN